MIHTADEAYLALADYRNGALAWRTGQFVLITEPELVEVLKLDGGMALLQPLSRAAFLKGPAHQPVTPQPVDPPLSAATETADGAEPVDAGLAAEPAPNTTVAAGKPRGHNRMTSGAVSQSRKR